MKTIAIDLDDTLQPFMASFIEWLNKTYNENYDITQIITYKMVDSIGGNIDWNERLNRFELSEVQHELGPFAGAKSVIEKLSEQAKLIIVTARLESQRKMTEDWLDREFPGVFADLNMRDSYAMTHNKGEICKHLGASILIDDGVHNIDTTQASDVRGILFGDYPMQQQFIKAHHERALDWEEVAKLLL